MRCSYCGTVADGLSACYSCGASAKEPSRDKAEAAELRADNDAAFILMSWCIALFVIGGFLGLLIGHEHGRDAERDLNPIATFCASLGGVPVFARFDVVECK